MSDNLLKLIDDKDPQSLAALSQFTYYEWHAADKAWRKTKDSDPDPPALEPGIFDGQLVEVKKQ